MKHLAPILLSGLIPAASLLALAPVRRLAGGWHRPLELPEALSLAAALALAWAMLGGMVLGTLGGLCAVLVGAWYALGAALCLAVAWRSRLAPRALLGSLRGWGWLWLLAPPTLYMLLLASVQPWYRDSLTYHLALPRLFAMRGGYVRPDDNAFASFPLGWESALATLHALGAAPRRYPPFNPRLWGVWTTLAAAFATVSLARRSGGSKPLAAVAGALLLLVPTVVEIGSSCYVEPALLLFSTLGLWAALRSLRRGIGAEAAFALSAVLVGLALWVKYPALALFGVLGLGLFILQARAGAEQLAPMLKRSARWFGLALLVGCPFYLRNVVQRGNPVYPMLHWLFGGRGWDHWRAAAYDLQLSSFGLGRELSDYLLLPLRLFTYDSLEGGFEGSIGPLVALGLPIGVAALIGYRRAASPESAAQHRWYGWALLVGWLVAFSVFWALTVQQARFYLVALPSLLALVTLAPRLLGRRRLGRPLALMLVAVQLWWSLAVLGKLWSRQHTSDWLAGGIDPEQLVARMQPLTHPTIRQLDALLPERARVWLVWMRGHTYYLHRDYRLDSVFEAWRLEALLDRSPAPDALAAALQRDGITHLLVNHRFFLANEREDLRPGRTRLLRARFAAAVQAGRLRPLESWNKIVLYSVEGAAP